MRWIVIAQAAALLTGASLAGCGTGQSGGGTGATAIQAPSPASAPITITGTPSLPLGPPRAWQPSELDRLLDQHWASAHVTPAAPADDAEFLRRVTLDLLGRIPSLAEVDDYLQPRKPDKRVGLVARLLNNPDHAQAWADMFADLFVGRQFRKRGPTKQLDPRSYFVDAIRENRPFDRLATELLTFTGDMDGSGPGVFLAAQLKGGGAEAAAAATARLFLGVQLQCAQCHDHPYDGRYKQEDFYGLAAYFAGTKSRERRVPTVVPQAAARVYSIVDLTKGQTTTFRRPGSPEDVLMGPRFLGHELPPWAGESRRQTLARAVVQSDLFAKAVVNWTWARLFGAGLMEPWDDLGGENDPRHPPLLNRLAEDFRRGGYDLRHLLTKLVLSRAYGLTSRAAGPPPASGQQLPASAGAPDGAARFARASVRRQTPEQIFRSLLVATGVDRMERHGGEPMQKKIDRLMREYLFVFGDEEQAAIDTFNGNIPQALLLWNGEIVNQGARARPGGVLAGILAGNADVGERLGRMFRATLSRPPTAAEQARLVPILGAPGAGTAAYEDVFFALLTSTEMLTIH